MRALLIGGCLFFLIMLFFAKMVGAQEIIVKDAVDRCKEAAAIYFSEAGVLTLAHAESRIQELSESLATHQDSVFEKGVPERDLRQYYATGEQSVTLDIELYRTLAGKADRLECGLDYSGLGTVKIRHLRVDSVSVVSKVEPAVHSLLTDDFFVENIDLFQRVDYALKYWLGLGERAI